MNLLFLRGAVPTDRDPNEIVFNTLEELDDVWSQLAYAMCEETDNLELVYYGGNRRHKFKSNFTERWVPTLKKFKPEKIPDVIFARGGFEEYKYILNTYGKKAITIVYGAGKRFLPLHSYDKCDIILQDSEQQLKLSQEKFPDSLSTLFIKAAADNIFYPHNIEKEYDICFPANGSQNFKGHKFVYSTVPKDLNILNLGKPSNIKIPDNVTSYRVQRSDMAKHISKCSVGIVCVDNDIDSCPRVIPELLACDLPIVVLNDIRFWKEKYCVRDISGELTTRDSFWDTVRFVLNNLDRYTPRKYYDKELSLKKSAEFIVDRIKEVQNV